MYMQHQKQQEQALKEDKEPKVTIPVQTTLQPAESKPDSYGLYALTAKNMVSGVNLFGAVKKLSVSGMSVRNMFYKQPKKQDIVEEKKQLEVLDVIADNTNLKIQVKGADIEE